MVTVAQEANISRGRCGARTGHRAAFEVVRLRDEGSNMDMTEQLGRSRVPACNEASKLLHACAF